MRRLSSGQQGVALAMILWILAALALMTASIMYTARTDVELTQLNLARVKARAISRGAAHLAMGALLKAQVDGDHDGNSIFTREFEFEGISVSAAVIPDAGFINMNAAPEALIAELLLYNAGLGTEEASVLSRSVVEWREGTQGETSGVLRKFEVVEDLLQVPGMTRRVYDGIYEAVSVSPGGALGISEAVAPEAVLRVLHKGDPDAAELATPSGGEGVQAGGQMVGQMGGQVGFSWYTQEGGVYYCLVITIRDVGEFNFEQRVWVEAIGGPGGLPWRISRVMPMVVRTETDEEALADAG